MNSHCFRLCLGFKIDSFLLFFGSLYNNSIGIFFWILYPLQLWLIRGVKCFNFVDKACQLFYLWFLIPLFLLQSLVCYLAFPHQSSKTPLLGEWIHCIGIEADWITRRIRTRWFKHPTFHDFSDLWHMFLRLSLIFLCQLEDTESIPEHIWNPVLWFCLVMCNLNHIRIDFYIPDLVRKACILLHFYPRWLSIIYCKVLK